MTTIIGTSGSREHEHWDLKGWRNEVHWTTEIHLQVTPLDQSPEKYIGQEQCSDNSFNRIVFSFMMINIHFMDACLIHFKN